MSEPTDPLPAGELVVRNGKRRGTRLPLRGPATVIGSADGCDAMHANIFPPTFSAGLPYIVPSSAPGSCSPGALPPGSGPEHDAAGPEAGTANHTSRRPDGAVSAGVHRRGR